MIIIRTNANQVINTINRLKQEIPKAANRSAYNMARFAVKAYKSSAKAAGIKPWGGSPPTLFGDTTWRKRATNRYDVFMPIHGVYLDSMHTHFVPFYGGRGNYWKLRMWAQSKGIDTKKLPGITVHPHPFMDMAWMKIREKAGINLRNEVMRSIKKR